MPLGLMAVLAIAIVIVVGLVAFAIPAVWVDTVVLDVPNLEKSKINWIQFMRRKTCDSDATLTDNHFVIFFFQGLFTDKSFFLCG